jgi:integrase
LALEAVRGHMVEGGRCRNRVNKDVARVKRLFRWAASKKLVSVSVYQQLQTVEGLRAGRSAAKETAPIKPVADAVVGATLPHLSPQVAAMVRLQRLTGMRPGEVAVMRGMDLEMSGPVWLYRPGSDKGKHGAHKNAYRGQDRVIPIGPRGQEVLRPWLRLNLQEHLFQPREARAWWDAERRKKRRTPMTPSQAARRPKRNPKRRPGEPYTGPSYACAVAGGVVAASTARACKACQALDPVNRCPACKASALPHWHPNQLRHAKATELRREAGLDAARVVLGHRSPQITEVYAELDVTKAAEVMERLG